MILKNHAAMCRPARRGAFTLMEMLVVVAIIVALAGIGGVFLIGQLNESKVSTAKMKARNIAKALEIYLVDNNEYPQSLEQLLQKHPTTGKGPYLTTVDDLLDPWGRQFNYDQTGQKNLAAGAVVPIPDVFCQVPNDTRIVGNFKDAR